MRLGTIFWAMAVLMLFSSCSSERFQWKSACFWKAFNKSYIACFLRAFREPAFGDWGFMLRLAADTKNTLISHFLTHKKTFKISTPKHTNSHFFYTRLKMCTPALPVVSVTNIRSECDKCIWIFQYIGHKYLFGHSFV